MIFAFFLSVAVNSVYKLQFLHISTEYSQRINIRSFKEVNRGFERFWKKLQAVKVAQVMLTTGNDKLNDAAKELVIIKQLKGKILHKLVKLCKQETTKDSEVSDVPAPPAKTRKLH